MGADVNIKIKISISPHSYVWYGLKVLAGEFAYF